MKPNRILIVKLSSLGDLFHALPAVHCLREQLDAEIHWVTQTEYAGLVGCFTDVSRIIVYNRRAPIRGFGALWRELRAPILLCGLFLCWLKQKARFVLC